MPFLNPDRRPSILHPQGHPVAVIAAFHVNGDLIPRFICIEDDYSELFKFKISEVKSIKDKYMLKEFYCSYEANGFRNDIILLFDIAGCRWVIG